MHDRNGPEPISNKRNIKLTINELKEPELIDAIVTGIRY